MNFYNEYYARTRQEAYSRHFVRFLKVKSILNHVKLEKGSLVLDLGCGLGNDLRVFSMFGMVAVGIDLSRVGSKRAKKKGTHSILANVKNLPFRKKVFDMIYSSDLSILSLESPNFLIEFIDRISEYLKKNGLLVFLYSSNLSGMRHCARDPTSWVHHKKEFFGSIFRKTIFGSNFHIFLCPLVMVLGKNHFLSFLRGLHNILDRIPCRSWIIVIAHVQKPSS